MKKIVSIICMVFLLISNLYMVLAETGDSAKSKAFPEKPYEKVVAKEGEWYTDRVQYDNASNLVIGYLGKHETDKPVSEISFKVNEKAVITGIYLPVISGASEVPAIVVKDVKGNIYQGFAGRIETARNSLVYTSNSEIVFDKGEYAIQLDIPGIATGAYLIKGTNYDGYKRYKDTINNEEGKVIGDEALEEGVAISFEPAKQDDSKTKKPAFFGLDAEYGIDEILINTYNNGNGVAPGTISIADEKGTILLTEQASGSTFAGVPNGMWRIAPMVLLPEGMYQLKISKPEAWTYDENMEPLFYVKASVPAKEKYNFTGTYMVNVDAYKTSTLMGTVSSKQSSFSLKDFELTVIHRKTGIELIGKYEDMPFSQMCEIIEETENKVVGKFRFGADLSKLPYNAAISAGLNLVLEKTGTNPPNISITGDALYTRAATKEKGADRNTYDVAVKGVFKQKELPPFVVTAIGKSNGAVNIPGPDNAAEAAAGVLFPPLVGLVVNVLTEMIRKKDAEEAAQRAAKKKSGRRDKEWYIKQNPGKTDEQIAMIMLADAMGNTDEPDEGDAESIGDNEIAEAKAAQQRAEQDSFEQEQAKQEKEYELEQEKEEAIRAEEEKRIQEEIQKEAPKTKEEEEKPAAEAEPETMVLKTSANGAQELYVKDPATGQWVNAETGNVLDYEDYKNRVVGEMEADKKWNDAEFEKNSKGEMEQDKINREKMEEISDNEKWEEYKEKMRDKYHEDDLGKIEDKLEEKAIKDRENFEKWQTIGDVNQVGETGSKIVGAGADIGVDILAEATGPYGKGIKAGYKVLKSTAGNVAEKQVTKEGGATWGDALEGAIKGTGDAAADFIKADNKYAEAAAKAATNIVSETGGSMAGAAVNGEDVIEAGKAGLVDGVTKATVNTVSDAIAGDTPEIPKDASVKDAMKKVIVNKFTATKATTAAVDELAAKPAAQEIKDFIKNEPKKK